MNLRASKLRLIFLSALILFSCGEDEINTIGLPPENNLGIFFVEIPLGDVVNQVWVNDISTRRSGMIFAGRYDDPSLGEITAQNFSEFVIPSINPGKLLGPDAMVDSMVMELRIDEVYGANLTTAPQTIEVYQLQDTIVVQNQDFYNNANQEVGMKLGEGSFIIFPDSIDHNFEDTNLPDSAVERALYDAQGRYIYKSNIKLDDAFAQTFFTELKDTTSTSSFSSNQNFAAFFKGLRISGTPSNSAVIGYNSTSAFTALTLFFTETVEGAPVQKTIRFTINSVISYNNITPNADVPWSGGDIDGLSNFYQPYDPGTESAYLQAGTHLFLKFDMSSFEAFADTLDNPIIQSAVLLLENPREYPSEATRFPLPPRLNASVTSLDSLETGNIRIIQEVASDLPSTFDYNSDDDRYSFELPVYLQSLIDRDNPFNQIILTPVSSDPLTNSLRTDISSLDRMVIDKANIKLRLYYTIPNSN